ncbi:lysozyme inhibitor LprI family protein [Bacillus sp. 1P02SD]|uniref:lysozyme inhibitor LprI family protein n=1 Tax=Bacillus sp. 1P02SD TaxID=3132264 RepID=UPI00399FA468
MENNKKFVITIITILLVLLAACSNSKDEVSEKPDTELIKTASTQTAKDDSSNPGSADNAANPDNTETDTNDKETNSYKKVDTSNNASAKDEEISTNSRSVSTKDEYLKKLNNTKKEADRMEATDTSTFALKKLENDRWEIWDGLLNDIYGVLNEQLPTDEMDQLREEQRKWIKYRDDTALEASNKYKGGTQEHLEYVAVLANLTEERCYELVEDYMM